MGTWPCLNYRGIALKGVAAFTTTTLTKTLAPPDMSSLWENVRWSTTDHQEMCMCSLETMTSPRSSLSSQLRKGRSCSWTTVETVATSDHQRRNQRILREGT